MTNSLQSLLDNMLKYLKNKSYVQVHKNDSLKKISKITN